MNKSIVILTGTPQGKTKFTEVAQRKAWVWSARSKNKFPKIAKELGWSGEKDEMYQKFEAELFNLANGYFNFEEKYVRDIIEKFLQDEDEFKTLNRTGEDGQIQRFDNFLLVLHGVTRGLAKDLENDGVIAIHIDSKSFNTVGGGYDMVLYEDSESFETDIENLLSVLLKREEKQHELK